MSRGVRIRPVLPGDLARREAANAGDAERAASLCRFCARAGLKKAASWHRRCVRVYKAGFFRINAVRWLLRRQRGVCATCTRVIGERDMRGEFEGRARWLELETVQIDHVVPLWRVALMPEERRTIRWWLTGNMQALCRACHAEKTKREAAERARERSAQRSLEVFA